MAGIGLLLIVVSCWRGRRSSVRADDPTLGHPMVTEIPPYRWQPAAFALLLASCLVIPSDWTQDVPKRYGKRHAGLTYSTMYPRIESFPKDEQQGIHSSGSSNQVAPGERKGATLDKKQNLMKSIAQFDAANRPKEGLWLITVLVYAALFPTPATPGLGR